METIVLTGEIDPLSALDLRTRLAAATASLRPIVTVDMSGVSGIHVAGAAALIDAANGPVLLGGELRIISPASERARDELRLVSPALPRRPTAMTADLRRSFASATGLLSAAMLTASAANYALNLGLARLLDPAQFGDATLMVTLLLGLTAAGVALQLITARAVSDASHDGTEGIRARLATGRGSERRPAGPRHHVRRTAPA